MNYSREDRPAVWPSRRYHFWRWVYAQPLAMYLAMGVIAVMLWMAVWALG